MLKTVPAQTAPAQAAIKKIVTAVVRIGPMSPVGARGGLLVGQFDLDFQHIQVVLPLKVDLDVVGIDVDVLEVKIELPDK